MNVTKDVVIDLLPAYLSGEASADTRALIEEVAAREPAVKRLVEAARREGNEPMLRQPLVLPPNLERETVSRTRSLMYRRHWVLVVAIVCTLLPFAFGFHDGHVTFWLLRDEKGFRLLFVLAAAFWLDYGLLGRRLRMEPPSDRE